MAFGRRLRAGLLLLGLAGGALAQHAFIKDGLPCLDGICVGDDAANLGQVSWQKALSPATGIALSRSRASQRYLDRLRKTLRGDEQAIRTLAPYWYWHLLDGDGIRALAGIDAVCEPIGVAGRLKAAVADGPAGSRTVVSFEPVAPRAGAAPHFVVASIVRYLPSDDSARLRVMADETARRYGGLPQYASATLPGVAWVPRSARGPHLKLLAPFGDPLERDARLRADPLCRADPPPHDDAETVP